VFEFLRQHALALVLAGLMHAVLIAALVLGLPGLPVAQVGGPAAERPPVQAVAVSEADLRAVEQQREARRQAEVRRQREAEEARRLEQLRVQREREEAEQKARAEAERQAEAQRAAETARKAEEARKVEEARKAEAARKAEEARRAEEARKAEEARRKEEARKAEEARRAEEARKAAEAAAQREAERLAAEQRAREETQRQLAAQIEEEQRIMRLRASQEYGAWLGAIQSQVQRNWNRPPSARAGLACEVRVGLIPGMEVVSAEIVSCNGDDAVRRSILAAVERASPLPRPSDPALFERSIVFIFKPEE